MNPHRLGWGFAYSFPFALVIGAVTLVSVLFSVKKLRIIWPPIVKWLVFFNLWMLVTTFFSLQPEESWPQLEKVYKIQLVIFLSLWLMYDKERIHSLIWIIVLSIGFFGLKGGVFTILTGGGAHVVGPTGSFIAGNTEIGLALVMIFPLIWYLYLNAEKKWIRNGLLVALFLTPIAILGTQSRGALLAVVAMTGFLWLKSRNKMALFIAILLLAPLLFMFMPQSWHERMDTIKDPHSDLSAMGRMQAWNFAYQLALVRPITGGGFESFNEQNYERYTPNLVGDGTGKYHDVHSIYFEILGEHGFVGLTAFLMILYLAWRTANRIMRLTKFSVEDKWAYDLASMIQVSMIGYAVGGAFLGLAYFDLIYHLISILVLTSKIVEANQAKN